MRKFVFAALATLTLVLGTAATFSPAHAFDPYAHHQPAEGSSN